MLKKKKRSSDFEPLSTLEASLLIIFILVVLIGFYIAFRFWRYMRS